jgi:lysine 2,3-aminomutase
MNSPNPPPNASLNSVDDLISAGLVAPSQAGDLARVAESFRIRITPEMAEVESGGVAAQFVPDARELVIRPEEMTDPIGDTAHSPTFGLTHRYPDRVILAATHACEVYCRFCFRREVVGEAAALPDPALTAALDYIAKTPAIWEVILTGGDPMSLSPRRIAAIMARLSAIPHVQIVRLHTRVPVVAPQRIDDDMIAALRARPTVYIGVHTNHAGELTPAARAALARIADAGIPMVSQTVLLRGVNDNAATLETLFRALLILRVQPYYLHHCDLAQGTSHFRTTIAEGQAIMAQLRGRMSGMGVPTYVLDIPGGFGKVPIGPDYLERGAHGYTVTDWQGAQHIYRDPDQ